MDALALTLFVVLSVLVLAAFLYRWSKGTFRRLAGENTGLLILMLIQLLLLDVAASFKIMLTIIFVLVYGMGWLRGDRIRDRDR